MNDDAVLVMVGLFQLAFGVYLGWLRWGRGPVVIVRREPRETATEHGARCGHRINHRPEDCPIDGGGRR